MKTNLAIYGKVLQYNYKQATTNYLCPHTLFLKDCISQTAYKGAFTSSISVWKE